MQVNRAIIFSLYAVKGKSEMCQIVEM